MSLRFSRDGSTLLAGGGYSAQRGKVILFDVKTGKRAKVHTIAVSTGSCSLKELKTLKPWRIIGKIGMLKTIITEKTKGKNE